MEGLAEAIKTIREGGRVITQHAGANAALVMNCSIQGIPFGQVNKVVVVEGKYVEVYGVYGVYGV